MKFMARFVPALDGAALLLLDYVLAFAPLSAAAASSAPLAYVAAMDEVGVAARDDATPDADAPAPPAPRMPCGPAFRELRKTSSEVKLVFG